MQVAVDSQGNAWFTNYLSVTNVVSDIAKFSPLGAAISPSTGFTGGGINAPSPIAIDNEDNVWVGNSSGQGSLTKLSNAGVPFAGSPFTGGGLSGPSSLAFDPYENLWITNTQSLSKFSSAGFAVSPASGYSPGGHSVAVDSNGSVFVITGGNHTITKLTNSAALVSGFPVSVGSSLEGLTSLAIDAQQNLAVITTNPGSLYKLTNLGTTITGYPIAFGSGTGGQIAIDGGGNSWIQNGRLIEVSASGLLKTPNGLILGANCYGIAIDGSGNIWVATPGLNEVEEVIGAAIPVITPIAAAVKAKALGSRP